MEIILLQDVEKVGLRGDVVNVADGYARNFLIPRHFAERATAAKVAELRKREEQRARHEARNAEQAQQIAERLGQTELRFEVAAGPTGRLFGSVTPTNVADEIWRLLKVRVDRRKIDLPEPIKRIGRYELAVEIFPEVVGEVRTVVVPEGGELPSDEELAALEAEERGAEEAAVVAEQEQAQEAALAVEEALAAEDEDEGEGEEGAEAPEPVTEADEPVAPEAEQDAAEPAPER